MIFDTDALIWLGRGDVRVRDVFEADHSPAMSLVTLIELFQGSRSAAELAATRGFVRKLGIRLFPVTEGISYRAVALIENIRRATGFSWETLLSRRQRLNTTRRSLPAMCGTSVRFPG